MANWSTALPPQFSYCLHPAAPCKRLWLLLQGYLNTDHGACHKTLHFHITLECAPIPDICHGHHGQRGGFAPTLTHLCPLDPFPPISICIWIYCTTAHGNLQYAAKCTLGEVFCVRCTARGGEKVKSLCQHSPTFVSLDGPSQGHQILTWWGSIGASHWWLGEVVLCLFW